MATATKDKILHSILYSDSGSDSGSDDGTLPNPEEQADTEEVAAEELLVKKKVKVGKNFNEELLCGSSGLDRIYEQFPAYMKNMTKNDVSNFCIFIIHN